MIGREVILTNRAFTLEELYAFMEEHWDKEGYSGFTLDRPTAASVERYILLPATQRHLVIVYPRAAGGLFNKENKVILSVAQTKEGAAESLLRSIPTGGRIIAGAVKIGSVMSQEADRKGPAQDALIMYTEHMKAILGEAGHLK